MPGVRHLKRGKYKWIDFTIYIHQQQQSLITLGVVDHMN